MPNVNPSTEAAVLRANAAFYRAFNTGNFPEMSQLWAKRTTISCLHPGAPPLLGRGPVLDSWRELLAEQLPVRMRCDQPQVHMVREIAVVTCYEGNDRQPAHLAATNMFVHEDDGWRLVHHQAGPLSNPIPMPIAVPKASPN